MRTNTLFFVSQAHSLSLRLMLLNDVVDWILTKPLIFLLFACTTIPEKYYFIEDSDGEISTAFVTGFRFGFSQLRIEILEWEARSTVTKRLKYIDISLMLSCCSLVGNSTVSLISRVASISPAFTKKASDCLLPFSCSTGASGGASHVLLFGGDSTWGGWGYSWGEIVIPDEGPLAGYPPLPLLLPPLV